MKYITIIDRTDYDQFGNPGINFEKELARIGNIAIEIEAAGGWNIPESFSDGDCESGMCEPDLTNVFQLEDEQFESLINSGKVERTDIEVYSGWDKQNSVPFGKIA